MKVFRPRTFLNLVLIGFVMVSLPLGVGLWTTLTFIDRVSGAGLQIVEHALNGTRTSEVLSEMLRNEERSLRLYGITGDTEHLGAAERFHARIDSLLYDLFGLPLDPLDRQELEALRHTRNVQRTVLISLRAAIGKEDGLDDVEKAIASFADQQYQAQQTRNGFNEMMEREIARLQQTTAEAQQALVYQTGAFILATLILIGVMAFLLSWPIRQLNKSVERLGKGDFKTPVLVSGPLDIQVAGERLDWLRKRLDDLEREKATFLAHVSHELKTPLASIREGAALLSEEVTGTLNPKQRDVAGILVNNSIVLQGLIENIINYNMASFNRQTRTTTEVSLREVIDKVVQDQTARVLASAITLDIAVSEATVSGDIRELEAIFENLFSNAIKFSPIGGRVGCRVTTDGINAACIVYDSGPGIPAGEEESVFQPFYQIGTAVRSTVRGSGLGLAIVKDYVQRHGGSIKVLNPGEPGARFGLILPLARRGGGSREGGS